MSCPLQHALDELEDELQAVLALEEKRVACSPSTGVSRVQQTDSGIHGVAQHVHAIEQQMRQLCSTLDRMDLALQATAATTPASSARAESQCASHVAVAVTPARQQLHHLRASLQASTPAVAATQVQSSQELGSTGQECLNQQVHMMQFLQLLAAELETSAVKMAAFKQQVQWRGCHYALL
jgi:hypothetical protein